MTSTNETDLRLDRPDTISLLAPPAAAPVASPALSLGRTGVPVQATADLRIRLDGKHLSLDGRPFKVRGATYGSFRSRTDGELFPEPTVMFRDFAAMAQAGLNVVRTYTLPPTELLDLAAEFGMYVLAGLYYDDWRAHLGTGRSVHRRVADDGRRAVDAALERLAGRGEVLAVSIGNEIPADLVRMHGIRPIESTLARLVEDLHAGDGDLLVTYSNYPTTEYLQIPGLDLTCFNVFLEDPPKLRAYLRHLQVVAGETPLLITELGLAGDLHGDAAQARALDWQLRGVDEAGCAGATVFAWTDEWAVADKAVEGWGFGLTRADRSAKPALDVVSGWARRSLRDARERWPSVSVVVCAYNEARLLHQCLDSLAALDYPNLEVILCDDGSVDTTLDIMLRYPFTVLALPHAGLSAARNSGLAAATGEIVAYLDADAHCHSEWLYHLVLSMEEDGVVATGGPNLPVVGALFTERAVAASPGGPVEVLIRDDRAEHVPGCNMAFRRDELTAIGGFDVVYTSAGDDVDVCWKLLDRGGEIAFAHAAQVRHHRRSTVRAYLKQQRGYGRSEKMVASRHPHRFNRLGQARWAGAIYGGLRMLSSVLRPVIYHGSLGSAPYQSVVERRAESVFGWYAALLPLTLPLALLGVLLAPITSAALILPAVAGAIVTFYAVVVAVAAVPSRQDADRLRWRALVSWLHVAQPFVRTWGRLRGPGLDPGVGRPSADWTGDRLSWLMTLSQELAGRGFHVRYGGGVTASDLTVSRGPLVRAHVHTAVVWGWTPHWRVDYSLHPRAVVLAIALVPVLAVSPVAAVIGLHLLAAMGVTERLVAHRGLLSAIRLTTRGAAPVAMR